MLSHFTYSMYSLVAITKHPTLSSHDFSGSDVKPVKISEKLHLPIHDHLLYRDPR